MKFGLSRDTVASRIQNTIFNKQLYSLIASPQDMIKFLTSTYVEPRNLYFLLDRNIKEKIMGHGGTLKAVYVNIDGTRHKITWENSNDLFEKVLRYNYPVIFKIMIRNKYYEFTTKQ